MRLADIIASLQAGDDPNQAVLQAFQPGGGQQPMMPPIPYAGAGSAASTGPVMPPVAPVGDDAAPVAPPAGPPPSTEPPSATPTGVPTPVTNPAPSTPSPVALQSPPDLANMYVKLMEKNQNAAQLDSGLTLMAAGLSNNLTTRNALIQHSGAGGGRAGSITSADLINLQKQDQSNRDMLLRRSMLGGLAKQYNLSPETITTLETSGKLDEVIAAHNTGHLTKITDAATGQETLVHPITGKVIAKIGGEKPEETQFVTGPAGEQLRSKKTGQPIGPAAGPTIPEDVRKDALMLEGINQERVAAGKSPLTMEEYVTSVKREPRAAANAADVAALEAINAERKGTDKPLMGMEEFLTVVKRKPGVTVNVGQDGTVFNKPPEGYEYERNPDGKVKIYPDGKPRMYSASPKAVGEERETAQDIADKEKKAADVLKKEHKERVASTFASSNVGDAIDTALSLADKPGATGTFAKWGRTLAPITGMPWDTIDAKLKTVDANNVVTALNAMRAASPSGGALGNVTEAENKMLASIIASTNVYQETGEFKKGLIRIKAAMMVMSEQKYDDPDGSSRFAKDLKDRIDELSVAEHNRGRSDVKITIKPRVLPTAP